MLPRKLYELLPYLYMLTGIVSAVLIDSTIVLLSSLLLIAAGVFVLVMRWNFRRSTNERYALYQATFAPTAVDELIKRSGIDRRKRTVSQWPVLDDTGEVVFSERRTGERRVETV